eukprot:CAMPEP_0173454902 /NCGR_PEP_ID=MMETSP1357-20121228/53289_1 /TAXON_ID=77926 /ORGANISM="Hemiselmis rufescens, Strain PCC563" /LENGTH=96 /DNA_ID=CAMNT_0014421981 /DNA_START=36 /DNA_END=322 /DNA_ORIENTATION=+
MASPGGYVHARGWGEIRSRRLEEESIWLQRCESFDYNEVYDRYSANHASKVRAFHRKKRFGIDASAAPSQDQKDPKAALTFTDVDLDPPDSPPPPP